MVHLYISELDQWSYTILTLLFHFLIQRSGINQEMRWKATIYSGSSSYYAYAILPLYFDQWLRIHPTSDQRSRSPSGLWTLEISNLKPLLSFVRQSYGADNPLTHVPFLLNGGDPFTSLGFRIIKP
jgi:hypothetical protein